MDRLIDAIAAKRNPSIVGLDPTEALVPQPIRVELADEVAGEIDDPSQLQATQLAAAYYEFNRAIIDAVTDIVPAVKPQIAMYEALGPAGVDAYAMTCAYAHEQGLYVLGDVKRGDIGSTAAAYAKHLSGLGRLGATDGSQGDGRSGGRDANTWLDPWQEDAVTVNPYLGVDGITPFVTAAVAADKDLFVLVRTSNPSSSQLQELRLAEGGSLYERLADLVDQWGTPTIGSRGFARVGAVVGATHPGEGAALRARMPHTFFLVPGYGAQGGTAADVAGMFGPGGTGAIVNSSRGIIGAWQHASIFNDGDIGKLNAQQALDLVASSARQAALHMRDDLRASVY